MVENKPSPRKPRRTGAEPPDPSAAATADEPTETPDTSSPYVTPDDQTPDDTGPSDAVEAQDDRTDPNDTEEIPTSIDVEVPASSPTEDRAVLLARLQLLETENARLRAAATVPPPAPAAPRPRRKVGRSTAAVVLILIGALLAPVAVVGSWARGLVVDTDRYVDTVAPIAEDPLVQSAVANRITLAVVDALNVEQLTTQATDAVAGLDLPPLVGQAVTSLQAPLQEAITGFIRKNVTRIVSSDAFENTWEQANRAAHEQIVATLRGDPDALAQISDSGQLTLDITPIIEEVKTSLAAAGFTLVERIPTITVTFPIASSADLVRLQSAYRLIDIVGGLLPYLSLALLAAGVLAAQHRSRALVVAGLSLAGAMLLLGVGLAVGRSVYASSLPPEVQRVDTAVSIYDQFVSLLRIQLRVALVLGLLLAVIAFVAGGTTAARQLRASASRASASLRSAGDRRGISTGPVGVWLDQQRTLVRVVVISLAALALVLADRLTPTYVIAVFVVALLVLGLATLAARPRDATTVDEEDAVLV
ncbi:hypothetical protein [Cellulomonas terrae]|uniref:Integral membrane protein n=1 Tax=Cellulomonas terrae TaxID=311234 RepID=A0A511JFX7_9CELL|nr:hypothetical protein [Cellulomonas terrae]GEL96890.1 hypothetical protein CTE05_04370 [Cellulomonas terrae]